MVLLFTTLILLFSNEVIFFNEDRILVLSFTIVMFTLYTLAGEVVRFELSASAAVTYEELSFNAFLRRRLGYLLAEANAWFDNFQRNFVAILDATRLAFCAGALLFRGAAARFMLRQVA